MKVRQMALRSRSKTLLQKTTLKKGKTRTLRNCDSGDGHLLHCGPCLWSLHAQALSTKQKHTPLDSGNDLCVCGAGRGDSTPHLPVCCPHTLPEYDTILQLVFHYTHRFSEENHRLRVFAKIFRKQRSTCSVTNACHIFKKGRPQRRNIINFLTDHHFWSFL